MRLPIKDNVLTTFRIIFLILMMTSCASRPKTANEFREHALKDGAQFTFSIKGSRPIIEKRLRDYNSKCLNTIAYGSHSLHTGMGGAMNTVNIRDRNTYHGTVTQMPDHLQMTLQYNEEAVCIGCTVPKGGFYAFVLEIYPIKTKDEERAVLYHPNSGPVETFRDNLQAWLSGVSEQCYQFGSS